MHLILRLIEQYSEQNIDGDDAYNFANLEGAVDVLMKFKVPKEAKEVFKSTTIGKEFISMVLEKSDTPFAYEPQEVIHHGSKVAESQKYKLSIELLTNWLIRHEELEDTIALLQLGGWISNTKQS